MRILIADDDPFSTKLLVSLVKRWGYSVSTANDGGEAWEMIKELAPPLAIVDWMMPTLDGIQLCQLIRRHPVHTRMYVMMITSRESQADIVAGLEAGADDYLVKPFHADELRARLQVGVRLIEAHAETGRLLASISSILIGLNAQHVITQWNSAAEETLGVSAADAIGQPLAQCGIEWGDREALMAGLTPAAKAVHLEDLTFKDREGRERILSLTVNTVAGSTHEAEGFVLLASDVTGRRLLESQLRQAQKLEGIGQLAAGIAHEINTPMQYIGDNVRFVDDSVKGLDAMFAAILTLAQGRRDPAAAVDEARHVDIAIRESESADLEYLRAELPRALAQSQDGVGQVSRIVKAMKEFSHPGSGEKELVDINHAVENTLVVARSELKYVADIAVELDPEVPRVPCLVGEINQVLLNLIVNAAHAMADVAAAQQGRRGLLTVSTHVADGMVEIRIADTGTGIPEHVRTRVFEPFFTTKDVGRGTGQGLALAHASVVARHAGQIWFETESGKGTTFFVRLPITPGQLAAAASSAAA